MKEILKKFAVRPVAYYPIWAEMTGSVTGGVLLSQIFYWWNACGQKEFYKTNEELCQELCMGEGELKSAKNSIKELGFVKITRKGNPSKTYYDIDFEMVENHLTRWVKIAEQDGRKSPIKLGENRPTSTAKIAQLSITENTRDLSSSINSDPVQESEPFKKEESQGSEKHDPLKHLPLWMGNSALKRIIKIHSMIWTDLYGFPPTYMNWGMIGKLYKPLLSSYSEYQIASLIILHFDWKGADGSDEFTHKRLANKCFPIEWVPKAVNEYQAYLKNSLGLKFDEPTAVRSHVIGFMKPLVEKYK